MRKEGGRERDGAGGRRRTRRKSGGKKKEEDRKEKRKGKETYREQPPVYLVLQGRILAQRRHQHDGGAGRHSVQCRAAPPQAVWKDKGTEDEECPCQSGNKLQTTH